jgi:hypothetical protein
MTTAKQGAVAHDKKLAHVTHGEYPIAHTGS